MKIQGREKANNHKNYRAGMSFEWHRELKGVRERETDKKEEEERERNRDVREWYSIDNSREQTTRVFYLFVSTCLNSSKSLTKHG